MSNEKSGGVLGTIGTILLGVGTVVAGTVSAGCNLVSKTTCEAASSAQELVQKVVEDKSRRDRYS